MSKAEYLYALVVLSITFAFVSCSFATNEPKITGMRKGTVKTIHNPNGEIIDCVDINQQPAFDHPLLKDEKIDAIPEFLRKSTLGSDGLETLLSPTSRRARECPDETVPLLRQPEIDLDVVRKMKRRPWNTIKPALAEDPNTIHEYSIVELQAGRYYYAGAANISVWNPFVERDSEFSVSQIWVVKGFGDSFESIEAGWQVYPGLYSSDKQDPKLFVFWTADAYKKTGCYNLMCPGFNLRSNVIWPGATLTYSTVGSPIAMLDLQIVKDQETGHWWLIVNQEPVGYWSSSLFGVLADHAESVQWGGEITYNKLSGTHTSTQMGSGHFPNEGVGKAAYMSTLKVKKELDGDYIDPDELHAFRTNPNCYDILVNQNGNPYDGASFFYGGVGRSDTCPLAVHA